MIDDPHYVIYTFTYLVDLHVFMIYTFLTTEVTLLLSNEKCQQICR